MAEIIDLSFSPARANQTIEIFDSDDERATHTVGPSRKKNKKNAQRPMDAFIVANAGSAAPKIAAKLPAATEDAPQPKDSSEYLAQILEVLPDVVPEHAESLVRAQLALTPHDVLAPVLHSLFEDPAYPKVDRKGKRKRVEPEEEDNVRNKPKPKIDYASKDRPYAGGVHYAQLCLDQLQVDYPFIPKPYIRRILLDNHSLYAPTHIALHNDSQGDELPYLRKATAYRAPKKGKQKALEDEEFAREKEFIVGWIAGGMAEPALAPPAEEEECEDGLECACCFSDYAFEKMIQCPEGHLFCTPCMTQYAETLLGSHDIRIICMDQSGCKLAFPVDQLRRFLTPKLYALYERIRANKEVAAAGLEDIEECPFCDFKLVIENDQEKLFVCRNDDCAAVTCRQCKQLDHLPKSCKEVEEDKKLEGRHHVEEAMTRALMRNCPKCKKAFVKEMGCNKMTCPECMTLSCYVCRQVIKGYEHFSTQPGQPVNATSSKAGLCPLWDTNNQVENRHVDEVKEAAKRAMEEYKRDNPDADDANLEVEMPVAPPPLHNPFSILTHKSSPRQTRHAQACCGCNNNSKH
ncbi:hypothetical protein MKEN_01215900 [Mycena kentingensis (nom. inval.)]|nr:hypothetical protein MKEN_01215900 [Mycena kentingensis (nom. inval.)]